MCGREKKKTKYNEQNQFLIIHCCSPDERFKFLSLQCSCLHIIFSCFHITVEHHMCPHHLPPLIVIRNLIKCCHVLIFSEIIVRVVRCQVLQKAFVIIVIHIDKHRNICETALTGQRNTWFKEMLYWFLLVFLVFVGLG